MNPKLITALLLALFSTGIFSACTSAESKTQEEVVFDKAAGHKTAEEVVISNADFQKKEGSVSTTQETVQLAKRKLGDGSEVEGVVDGFGNKTESRYFNNHPRLKLVVLRTSVEGQTEVSVYGFGSEAKILNDFGERALTASGDEIANTAQLVATRSESRSHNFLKKGRTEQKPALQPLPSSAFQTPTAVEPAAPAESQTESKNESPQEPQIKDEDLKN